jgi:pyruvate/oxaloacetate carboxyltransferase
MAKIGITDVAFRDAHQSLFDTGLDVPLLARIALEFRAIRRKYRSFESSFLGADTRILTSQVPGGMLSNLESQLREQGKLDRMAARVSNKLGLDEDPHNFLLMHALGANVAGQIGSVVAAGIILALFGA